MGRRFWNKCRKKKFTPNEVKTTPTTRTILVISSLVAAFGYYAFFKKYLTQGFAPLISIQDTIHVLTLLLLTATIPLTPYFKSKKIIYISQITLCTSFSYTILFNNNIQTSIPQILNSPWLFSHVVLIIIAYSLFTLCALIALATFVVKNVLLPAPHDAITQPSRPRRRTSLYGHHHWRHLGWQRLGQLLAMGPQGGVGTHHALIIHYPPSPQ